MCSINSPPGQIIHLHTVENVHTTKFIDVYINDQHITAFIDSGASHCLMSENMFQTLQQSHGNLKLSGTHDGQQIDTAGNSVMAAVTKVGETSSDSPVIITSNGPKKAKDFNKNDIRDLAEDNGPIVCVLQQPSSSSSTTSLSHPQRDVRHRGSRSPPRKDSRRR